MRSTENFSTPLVSGVLGAAVCVSVLAWANMPNKPVFVMPAVIFALGYAAAKLSAKLPVHRLVAHELGGDDYAAL